MVAFSFDRPMQCDLMLKSFRGCVGDITSIDIYVLYKSSNEEFQKAYQTCIKENKFAIFIEQNFFYENVKELIENSEHEYVLFCTDDTIFTNDFMISEIEDILDENNNLLNFSLRLGANTVYCYPLSAKQQVPEHNNVDRVFYWDWRIAEYDFGYPLELSSSILRMKDVKKFVNAWTFTDPNIMEWYMNASKNNFVNRYESACFYFSVAFSAPMNKVKEENKNRSSQKNEYSKNNLLKLYLDDYRVIPIRFYKYISKGAHEEVEFEFERKIEKW